MDNDRIDYWGMRPAIDIDCERRLQRGSAAGGAYLRTTHSVPNIWKILPSTTIDRTLAPIKSMSDEGPVFGDHTIEIVVKMQKRTALVIFSQWTRGLCRLEDVKHHLRDMIGDISKSQKLIDPTLCDF